MKDIIRFLWIGLNALILVWFFLVVAWLLIPFVNGYLIPDHYNPAFNPNGISQVVTRFVLYGLAMLEWATLVAMVLLLNRLISKQKLVVLENVIKVGGLTGACILLLLAFMAT